MGKDAAAALGYADTAKAIRAHVDAEDKQIIKVDEMATLDVKSNYQRIWPLLSHPQQ